MILITGAGGYIGQRLVARLVRENWPLRCLIAQQHERGFSHNQDVELHVHNAPDDALWSQLVEGIDCIIHLRSAHWWGRSEDLYSVEILDLQALLRAARSAGVGRIITLSHLGATLTSGIGTLRLKAEVEELLKTSGLAYTIIRSALVYGEDDSFICHLAALLRANPLFFLQPGQGGYLQQPLHVNDLVEALARSLRRIDIVDDIVNVGGPEYMTFSELLQTIMRVTKMPRSLISVPPYFLRLLAQLFSHILPRSLITDQWFDLVTVSRTTSIQNLRRTFDIQPKRLEDTLRLYLSDKNHLRCLFARSFRKRPRLK